MSDAPNFPPPNPIPNVGQVMSPMALDWAIFGGDDGSKMAVLTIHTVMGSLHFAFPGAFVLQQVKPTLEELYAALGKVEPIVAKPKLVIPGIRDVRPVNGQL